MTKLQMTFLAFGLSFLSSCSSLFYYPDRNIYVNPQALPYQPQDVYFNSEDGTQLHGWFIEREDKKAKPKALVVHFHGNAQNLSAHFAGLEWIRKRGFDYFIFDYRGYGKSQGEPFPKGTVEDGMAAIRWAHNRSPETPLIVVGQSLGGAVALRAVFETQDKVPVKLVVADSTFHSYQEIGRKTLAKSWLFWLFQPLAYVLLSDKWAPLDKIGKLSPTKVLVVHGEKDHIMPISLGKRVFELAKEPKEFWEIKNGTHIDFTWRIQEGYRDRLEKEFEKAAAL